MLDIPDPWRLLDQLELGAGDFLEEVFAVEQRMGRSLGYVDGLSIESFPPGACQDVSLDCVIYKAKIPSLCAVSFEERAVGCVDIEVVEPGRQHSGVGATEESMRSEYIEVAETDNVKLV